MREEPSFGHDGCATKQFVDHRHPELIEHRVRELIEQIERCLDLDALLELAR